MGNVIGDLNGRRGKVHSMTPKGGLQIVDAEVPLMNLLVMPQTFVQSRKVEQVFAMEFKVYDLVPDKGGQKEVFITVDKLKTRPMIRVLVKYASLVIPIFNMQDRNLPLLWTMVC